MFCKRSAALSLFHTSQTKRDRMVDPLRIANSTEETGVWILVEDGDLKGMTMIADEETGDIVALSAKKCSSEEKRSELPSLKDYPSLRLIDLHNYRFMKNLDDSIGDLPGLERLILTRCDLLQTLPPSIGNLHNLVEVRMFRGLLARMRSRNEISIVYFLFLSA